MSPAARRTATRRSRPRRTTVAPHARKRADAGTDPQDRSPTHVGLRCPQDDGTSIDCEQEQSRSDPRQHREADQEAAGEHSQGQRFMAEERPQARSAEKAVSGAQGSVTAASARARRPARKAGPARKHGAEADGPQDAPRARPRRASRHRPRKTTARKTAAPRAARATARKSGRPAGAPPRAEPQPAARRRAARPPRALASTALAWGHTSPRRPHLERAARPSLAAS